MPTVDEKQVSLLAGATHALDDLAVRNASLGDNAKKAFAELFSHGNAAPLQAFLARMPAIVGSQKDPAARAALQKDTQALSAYAAAAKGKPGFGLLNNKGIVGTLEDSAKNAVGSLNPLAGLFQANIWLRVAEVGIGILLVAVGIAKLTNAIPAATKIAGVVSKMPIPV